jgi:hypothetical protein
MRRFGASNASRCGRPGEVIAPIVIAKARSAIPKKAPAIYCSTSANRVSCQQHSHYDCSAAGCNVSNPRRQRELPGQASVSPKHEEYGARDAINLSRHEPRQRDRGDEACDAFRSPQGNGGGSDWDQQAKRYGRHRVLCARKIRICGAKVLCDGLPGNEDRRQHDRSCVIRLCWRLHARGTHPAEAQRDGRHCGPDDRFE